MISTIIFEDKVRMKQLQDHVNISDGTAIGFHPEEDFKALSIIIWKQINETGWTGGRVGNKFFPKNLSLSFNIPLGDKRDIRSGKSEEAVYELKTGFLTSVRPGEGSLLLNIHATTSAFFPEMNLQEWIKRRFHTTIPKLGQRDELRDIKVVFECDGKEKVRSICEISNLSVGNQKFKSNDGSETTVLKHMISSKPNSSFSLVDLLTRYLQRMGM